MPKAALSPSQAFAPIKAQFLSAFQQYPDLRYAVVRGEAMSDVALRQMVCGSIARGQPHTAPSTFTHGDVYGFFYGTSLAGVTVLRSLSQRILTLVIDEFQASALQDKGADGYMKLPAKKDPDEEKKGLLPAPFHFVFNRQDVEHDWMDWLRDMARADGDSLLKLHEGHLTECINDKPTKDCPSGSYVHLPDGDLVGRAYDGEGHLYEEPQFPQLIAAIRAGKVGRVSMLRSDVFSASATGVDALIERIQRTQERKSPMLGQEKVPEPPAVPPNLGAKHNADFTMVNWFGTEYRFALGVQSSAVKALWKEWEQSGLGLHQDTIRNAIDAERNNFRMDKAFRNSPAFGTMIQSIGDGKYKLAPPNADQAKVKASSRIPAKARRKPR
ncbi:MAG TPA: hypothetical protein VHM90_19350 [Phycisphaerae bacterium]|nr:hypothetical protein [Phycisphaerae bacterium]